ncbi:hypothetical protein PG993_012818 [Apiospora rasikravindrae]|uniref:DUF805 domain-containing protein n=1 Tax=Apiospora rasikravindrae TaxID=990691 RepID=A0ABR1RVV8_9PEZI
MSSFPQELPPRPGAGATTGSWKDRNCPNMRTCWAFSWQAYSLATPDKAQLCRRICMWAILLVRTAMSILGIVRDALAAHVVSVIVYSILAVLGFFFIAWCLAMIGEVRGRRRVLGVMVGRWHFDIFLAVVGIIHIGILLAAIIPSSQVGPIVPWLIMWVAIFAVAWVATWPPEQDSQV